MKLAFPILEFLSNHSDEEINEKFGVGRTKKLARQVKKPSYKTWRQWAWNQRGLNYCKQCEKPFKAIWCPHVIPPCPSEYKWNTGLHYRIVTNYPHLIPPWVDWDAIAEFYYNCPPGMHVDHIYPLKKGGLHSIENLQYLTASENAKKATKIPEDGRGASIWDYCNKVPKNKP